LVQLERRQWHTKLFPLSKVPDHDQIQTQSSHAARMLVAETTVINNGS
jgi:hypothetical protein